MAKTGRPNREDTLRKAGVWTEGMSEENQKAAVLSLPADGTRIRKLSKYGLSPEGLSNKEADDLIKVKSEEGLKTTTIERAFRVRMYPKSTQAQMMAQIIGQRRRMWNYCVSFGKELSKEKKKFNISEVYTSTTELIKADSEELPKWMSLLPGATRNGVIRTFDKANKRAISYQSDLKKGKKCRRIGWPKFHGRRSSGSYGGGNVGEARLTERGGQCYVVLPKVGEIRLARSHYAPVGALVNSYTVHRLLNVWHVSLQITVPRPTVVGTHERGVVGIDPGIKTALTLVEQSGRVVQYDAPLPLKLLSAKKRRIERKVSRAYEARKLRNGLVGNKAKGPMGSNERSLRNDLAKLSAQIADIRRQWQHRTTDEICRRYSVIRIQPSIGPIKSGKGTAEAPGKKIRQRAGRNRKALDIGIGEICRQLLYKADWYGAGYEEVDQFFPSSQLCSKCFEKMVRMV